LFRYILVPYMYHVTLNPTPVPSDVRMVLARNRTLPQTAPVGSTFFASGNSSTTFLGTLADQIMPINKDTVVVLADWHHKVAASTQSTTSGQATTFYGANNDYSLNVMRTMDITKHYSKNIDWNDGASTPTNPGLWLNVIPDDADGTASAGTYNVVLFGSVEVFYEDF